MVTLLFSTGFVINRLIGVTVPYINYFFLLIFNLLPQVLIGLSSLFVAYLYSVTPASTENLTHAEIVSICERDNIHPNYRVSVMEAKVLSFIGGERLARQNSGNELGKSFM
jgi:hypothetical protein